MKLLAIETATEACSAALLIDGAIQERFEVAPRRHGELILPMAEALLMEAGLQLSQLDALAFGRGPGSFTGVRMATGVIQGLAFAADLPVVPVSTLAALAQTVVDRSESSLIYAALDARMNEIYWGVYQPNAQGRVQLLGEEQVIPASSASAWDHKPGIGVGHGWRTYIGELTDALEGAVSTCYVDELPRAAAVAHLAQAAYEQGQMVSAEAALPVYLRDNVAKVKAAN